MNNTAPIPFINPHPLPFQKAKKKKTIVIIVIIITVIICIPIIILAVFPGIGQTLTWSYCSINGSYSTNITTNQLMENLTKWDYSPAITSRNGNLTHFRFHPYSTSNGPKIESDTKSFIQKGTIDLTENNKTTDLRNMKFSVESHQFRGTNFGERTDLINYVAYDMEKNFNNALGYNGGVRSSGCSAEQRAF